jgi:hypothetical protein
VDEAASDKIESRKSDINSTGNPPIKKTGENAVAEISQRSPRGPTTAASRNNNPKPPATAHLSNRRLLASAQNDNGSNQSSQFNPSPNLTASGSNMPTRIPPPPPPPNLYKTVHLMLLSHRGKSLTSPSDDYALDQKAIKIGVHESFRFYDDEDNSHFGDEEFFTWLRQTYNRRRGWKRFWVRQFHRCDFYRVSYVKSPPSNLWRLEKDAKD